MKVAIEGVYPVFAGVEGFDSFKAALPEQGELSFADDDWKVDLSRYTGIRHAYLDPASTLALASVSGVIDDAGWSGDESVGLCVGTGAGCCESMDKHADILHTKGGRFCSPFIFSHSYPNSPNAVVSMDRGLKGYNNCLVCGSVSGGIAIGVACDQLSMGRSSRIAAGGTDSRPAGAACFAALSSGSEDSSARGYIRSWYCGHDRVENVIRTALERAEVCAGDIRLVEGVGSDMSGFDGPMGDRTGGNILGASMAVSVAVLLADRRCSGGYGVAVGTAGCGTCCAIVVEALGKAL